MQRTTVILISLCFLHLLACQKEHDRSQLSDDFDRDMPFYYGMPDKIGSTDYSPAWEEDGQKILLTGRVYQRDGVTPAENVLIYYYQTDTEGRYPHKADVKRSMPKNKLNQTHGYIRGWVKTDKSGNYAIYTIKPEAYPSGDEVAHVHINIKEPDVKEPTWIENFVFDDDPRLTTKRRLKLENRGGSGIIRFVEKDGLWIGERNIYLGVNMPENPVQTHSKIQSGLELGENIFSFTPYHAWGKDKGTRTCPICKYGWYLGILYFVGNAPDWTEIKSWLQFLEAESEERGKYLKVYFVYGNETEYSKAKRISELEELGKSLSLKQVALTFLPSFSDEASDVHLNKLNQEVKNTFLIYKRSTIIKKLINAKASEANFALIREQLERSVNGYFGLRRAGGGDH